VVSEVLRLKDKVMFDISNDFQVLAYLEPLCKWCAVEFGSSIMSKSRVNISGYARVQTFTL